jgi:hypothetical protein
MGHQWDINETSSYGSNVTIYEQTSSRRAIHYQLIIDIGLSIHYPGIVGATFWLCLALAK